jgi:uncharacterized protein
VNGVPTERLLLWRGVEEWLAEAATIELTAHGVRATGTQLGADPLPYRLDYALDAAAGFVTASLRVDARGDGWQRAVELRHDGAERWHVAADAAGRLDLPPPGGDAGALAGALDCDLALSPLTNVMPIRRHALHERPGAAELTAAWVSVPDLAVTPYRQRYEHVGAGEHGAVVRFASLGDHAGFVSDIEVDRDGLVVVYPALARRVGA